MKDLYKEITFVALTVEKIITVSILSLLYVAYRGEGHTEVYSMDIVKQGRS